MQIKTSDKLFEKLLEKSIWFSNLKPGTFIESLSEIERDLLTDLKSNSTSMQPSKYGIDRINRLYITRCLLDSRRRMPAISNFYPLKQD